MYVNTHTVIWRIEWAFTLTFYVEKNPSIFGPIPVTHLYTRFINRYFNDDEK